MIAIPQLVAEVAAEDDAGRVEQGRIGAAQAALVSTAEPVFVILFSALLLGESLTATQLAGGALIMAGVLLSQSRGSVRVGSPTLAGLAED